MIQKLFTKENKAIPIITINRKDVIFIHINKTGGTSIYKTLGYPRKIHNSARLIIDKIGEERWENSFKFTFVRNPWDKVVSHYKYRVKTNQTQLKKRPLSFNEWVKVTYGTPKDFYYFNKPKMFQPQVDWLVDHEGNISMDFIGRFEQLEEDFQKLCQKLGITKELPHLNATPKADYKEFYDTSSKEIVADWFQKDIKKFGYEF